MYLVFNMSMNVEIRHIYSKWIHFINSCCLLQIFSDHCDMGKTSAVSSNCSDHVAYNWMAPEIMNQCPPSFASDMYSYCCVVWEMIKCKWLTDFMFSGNFCLFRFWSIKESMSAVKLGICSQLLFHYHWFFC